MLNKIRIIAVGKVKEGYYRNKIEEYIRIVKKKNCIELIEIPDESIPKNSGESIYDSIKEKEGRRILGHISSTDYVAALCIEGKLSGSDSFVKLINQAQNRGTDNIVFVIGGSLGLHECVIKRADYRLSFSRMTFPHQLMRVMLLEQLAYYL